MSTALQVRAVILLPVLALISGAWAANPRPSALDSEPRLDALLDVSAREEPLDDFLVRVSRETGAILEAEGPVADERVTVFARGRPAREILAVVAEHLDYSWVRKTRGGRPRLVLLQDLAARRREEALRKGPEHDVAVIRGYLEARLRLAAGPEVRALSRLSPEQRFRRLEELDERLYGRIVRESRTSPNGVPVWSYNRVRAGPPPEPEERQALLQELAALYYLHPERREDFNPVDAAGRVYGLLSPDAREALWRGEPIRFGYPAEQGRVSIPPDIAAGVVASGLSNLSRRTDPVDGRDIRIPFRSVERVRGELVLESRGIAARLRVRVRTVGSYGLDDNQQRVEWTFDEPVEGRYPLFDPEFRGPYLDSPAEGLRQPLVLRAVPEKEDDTSLYLPDALERLSERVPWPIVADDYCSGGFGGQLSSDGKPLARFLESVCRVFQRTCSYRGGYLRFRHHDWPTRRAMEPPGRLVRRLEQSVRLRGALTLAELVEIGGLTPEQAEGVHYRLRERHPGFGRLLEADLEQSAPMLRLLHALPRAQRSLLESGRPLPLRALAPAALAQVRRCFEDSVAITGHEGSDDEEGRPFVPGSGFAEEDRLEAAWVHGVVTLARKPYSWVYTSHDWFPIEQLDQALASEQSSKSRVTEGDLKRVDGELVLVTISVPGARPIRHFFLAARAAI